MIDKDKSIITQVAAKIAADLAIHNIDIDTYNSKFVEVAGTLMEMIYGPGTETTSVVEASPITMVENAFGATATFSVSVKGKQHGPLPEWLIEACRKDGITEVYDNRDGLAENPKRPWFKAVNNKEKAYWAPRGK